jgi:hypothetical protein
MRYEFIGQLIDKCNTKDAAKGSQTEKKAS